MRAATRIPRWTIWSVLAGLAVTVAVSLAVDLATTDSLLDPSDRGRYLLTDEIDGLSLVASFESAELALDPRSGAASVHSVVLTDFDSTPGSTLEPILAWRPGQRVVVSEVLTFESRAGANDLLGSLWTSYALGAVEQQRGPDGSLLIFHPEFERGGGAPIAPVAVAAWPIGDDVLIITYVGAESASDVLELARTVEQRRTGGAGR